MNIEYLPTLYDQSGPFGNPSSDSRRAMIQPGRHEIATIIYSFDGAEELDYWLERLASYLKDYYEVVEAKTLIVKKC